MPTFLKKRNILISIKPRYATEILEGRKFYEFRRVVFNPEGVDKVIIYVTSPVKKIVAEFEVGRIISGTPATVWEECHCYSGIGKQAYVDYFLNAKKAFAISIENLQIYKTPIDPYRALDQFCPPQSYKFVDTHLDKLLNESSAFD